MNETIYEGETLKIALSKASEALGVAPEGIEYEVTEQNDGGFWGLDDSFVRLRAWPRAEDDEDDEAAEAAEDEAEGSPPEKDEKSEPLPTPPAEEMAVTTTPADLPTSPAASAGAEEREEAAGAEARGFWEAPDGADAADEDDPVGGGQKEEHGPAPDGETEESVRVDPAPATGRRKSGREWRRKPRNREPHQENSRGDGLRLFS